jgi:ribonuclease HI
MLPVETQQKFLEKIRTKCPDHNYYYTDGSVINNKAGFAVHGDTITISERIHDFSSAYTCELWAIKMCIDILDPNKSDQKSLIIVDSKSALEGILDPFSKSPIVQKIRENITKLKNVGISFLWIPSHHDVKGNEIVDTLAKSSLDKTVNPNFKYQFSDYKQFIKKYLHNLWNENWKNSKQTKLLHVQELVPHKFETFGLHKMDIIKLNRLKIGHCRFTHKHIIEKMQPPLCECGQILSILHIFNDCKNKALQTSKTRFKITDIKVLCDTTKFENVKKFLTELKLYDYI